MKCRSCHWPSVALAAALLTGVAAPIVAYTRPTTKPPTPADLLLNSGDSNTLGVVVLNLTPYEMSNPNLTTLTNQTNTDRTTKKSFMFAPVGVPTGTLPALAGTWGPDSVNPTCKVFNPDANNTTLHPYSMVFGFAERGGTVKEGHHSLRLENVWLDGCHESDKKDVDIGLFFSRIDPDKGMKAEVFREIASAVLYFVKTIGVVLDPASPLAWIRWVAATAELGSSTFELQNAVDDQTMQAYFAAYPWPEQGSPADMNNGTPGVITYCTKCSAGETSDGADVEWGNGLAGPHVGNIVVTTHLLRGSNATDPPSGSIAFVTLWTWDMYMAVMVGMPHSVLQQDPAGRRLHSRVGNYNSKKLFALAHLMGSMSPPQRSTYVAAYQALQRRHHLTDEQKQLLERLAVAFEKGRTSLEERAPHQRPDHGQRGEVDHE